MSFSPPAPSVTRLMHTRCVASGTNDVANQAILDLASEKDPTGDRTVGVITKCDIAQHPDQVCK